MKGVQCYELFGGIALKIHTFSFSFSFKITNICEKTMFSTFAVFYLYTWDQLLYAG